MTKAVWGARVKLAGAIVLALLSTSCGELTRQGQSSSYLAIGVLEAAPGAEPGEFGTNLFSDVITVVNDKAGIYADLGRVQLLLRLKDPGPSTSPATPTPANAITVERYHVKFIRSDGRNVQGVDVPYEFDGAFTVTVTGTAEASFTLVRHQAKMEAPLAALMDNGIIIATIAEVTFYGHDQTGRAVSAVGRIGVSFGNFADPE